MKRYRIALLAIAAVLLLVTAAFCENPFPNIRYGTHSGIGDGVVTVKMLQGWYNDESVWYFGTCTNDLRYATTKNLTLVPKLSSALEGDTPAARVMYVVLNYNQGPVFTAVPYDVSSNYSGLWQICFITWKPGFARPITNAQPESDSNPQGLPTTDEATICCSYTVVDNSILAVGKLGGPWLPAPGGTYRQGQVICYDAYRKTADLPIWKVYADDPYSKSVFTVAVVIPDVGDADLADLLHANLAPGLLNMPIDDTQRFWNMTSPKPRTQYPIIEDCPVAFRWPNVYDNPFSWRNTNFNYSPVMQYCLLNRNIPVYSVINNQATLERLLNSGGLTLIRCDQRMNAPVIAYCYL